MLMMVEMSLFFLKRMVLVFLYVMIMYNVRLHYVGDEEKTVNMITDFAVLYVLLYIILSNEHC
jgi:hypothetical protein